MAAHKHAEAIKAWADGAQIQIKDYDSDVWTDCDPQWAENREYRIKPAPLCQVEGKDVFPGDQLWHIGEKMLMTVEDLANTRDSLHMAFYGTAYIKNLTWTEPARTKTVYQWAIRRLGKWNVTASMFTTEDGVKAVFFDYEAYRRLDYTALEVPCDD